MATKATITMKTRERIAPTAIALIVIATILVVVALSGCQPGAYRYDEFRPEHEVLEYRVRVEMLDADELSKKCNKRNVNGETWTAGGKRYHRKPVGCHDLKFGVLLDEPTHVIYMLKFRDEPDAKWFETLGHEHGHAMWGRFHE